MEHLFTLLAINKTKITFTSELKIVLAKFMKNNLQLSKNHFTHTHNLKPHT